MSVLEIKNDLEKKADQEVSEIIRNARNEAEKILSEAEARIRLLKEEKTKTLMRTLDTENKAELAITRMDQKGEILKLKSEWASKVFEEVEKKVNEMSEKRTVEYHNLLSKLVLEGISKIGGKSFVIQANSKDVDSIQKEIKTIMDNASKIKNEKIKIKTKIQPLIGGVIISTENMTQYYNNSLEARVSNARQEFSGDVYKILFGIGEQNE